MSYDEKMHDEKLEQRSGSEQLEAGGYDGVDTKTARTVVLKMDCR